MERGNTKHGPELDEALKHETEGLTHAGHATHAQEWKDPEPSGEDQPGDVSMIGGTPPGVTPEDVAGRSELARYLGPSCFPATATQLLETAARNGAPESVLGELRHLPTESEYENAAQVWQGLGGGLEQRSP